MSLVSKYKRGGVWYLRYAHSIGLKRKSLQISDAKQAEAIRLNEEHRLLFGTYGICPPQRKSILFSELSKRFLEFKVGQGKARNTTEAYRYALNNFGLFLHRDEPINLITLESLEAFAAERRRAKKSEKTIRNELITLATAFKWAKRQGYVSQNPAENLDFPKRVKAPPRYLTKDDYIKLRKCIDDDEFRDVVDFYLLSGARRAEALLLEANENLDFEQRIIRIPQPKQHNYKTLPISDELLRVVNRLLLRSNGNGRLIRYSEDGLTRKFKRYIEKAELNPALTFHSLRHTFATWLASAGVKQSSVQQLLGHSDPASTRIYVHLMEEDLSVDMAKLRLPLN